MLKKEWRILLSACFLFLASNALAREDLWTEVKSPNFTVISDASEKKARRAAKSLEQFRILLRTRLPQLQADPGSPLIVFAARDEKSLKEMTPVSQRKGAVQPAGMFMANLERSLVALRLDVPEDQAYHTIYHEYVHMVMRLNFPKMPLWVNEGLAELFANARVSDQGSSLGNPSIQHLETLQNAPMIPIATLITVTSDSPYYTQADKARIFYAQAWALIHYLMLGDKQARAGQLDAYLKLIQAGTPEKQAAEQAFGDIDALQRNLNRYVIMKGFYAYRIPTHLEVKDEEYPARTVSGPESLALRGQFLVASNRIEEARAVLEKALQMDPQSAGANEGMGFLSLRLGDHEKAQKFFSAAAKLDSRSFLAQYYAAQSEYEQGNGYKDAENYLRKSLEINPKFAPAYSLLAHLLVLHETDLPEALQLAQKAIDLEPADMRYRLNFCEVLVSMKKFDEAVRTAERAVRLADSGAERAMAQSMLTRVAEYRDRAIESQRREQEDADAARRDAIAVAERRDRQREMDRQIPSRHSVAGYEKPQPIKKGPPGNILGIIKSVACSFPAVMDVVVESRGRLQKLRAENYYEVQYEAIGGAGKNGFEPCEELEGKSVQINFFSVSGQEFSGLIQKVGILK